MADDDPLDGTVALVTGASSGIGRETARVLARDGAAVAVAARRESRLRDLASDLEAEYDATVLVVPTDVSVEEQVERLVETTVDELGGLDVAVSNAAIGGQGTIDEITTEQYRTLMGVNVDGMFFTARAALPHLRESTGNLIFVSSFAGLYPRRGNSVYAASKWWTRGFALSLAAIVGDDDVGVTVLSPSDVRTEIGAERHGVAQKDRWGPGEIPEPEDVAEAIGFAARQQPPNAVTELAFDSRDKLGRF